MSEHITHLAVAEDSARVVFLDPDFNTQIRQCIERFPDALRLGSVTRSGDTFILPLLTEWRKDWKTNDKRSEKMAYILGWAGHLAADRTFKPVFRITDLAYYVRGFPGPSHASVYHDAITFGQVYKYGKEAPFHPCVLQTSLKGHPAAELVPVNRLEETFAFAFADQLAGFKDFLPENTDDWTSKWEVMENERQRFYVDVDRYTEAHHQGDPDRLRQYIVSPNFYDQDDPIIQLARKGKDQKTDIQLSDALKGTATQSLYAQALKLGYDFMKTCSDYFEGSISLEQAKKNFRIGQPHKQALNYYVKQAKNKEEN